MSIAKQLAALESMTVAQLRAKWTEAFGEVTRANNRDWLRKRIAWRLQAQSEGDLSERARQRARELASDAELRTTAPKPRQATVQRLVPARASIPFRAGARLPVPGATILREYKGRTLEVTVLAEGFEFEGEKFASLSAVAKAITGQHWNGYRFFNLDKKAVRNAS